MRILVIDDHALFHEALILLLKAFEPAAMVSEASSSEEATSVLSDCPDQDLILLDLNLSGTNGLRVLPTLRKLAPTAPVIVLSAEQDPDVIGAALAAGAAGFVPKTAGGLETVRALRLILAGETYQPPARP